MLNLRSEFAAYYEAFPTEKSTVWIAQSPARYKEEAVRWIEKFLKHHIVKLTD
jgi:hypothetical protein